MSSSHESDRSVWKIVSGSVIALAVVAALAISLWPRSVKLSPEGYDVGVALYRVCNQQSDEGLKLIQARLKQIEANDDAETLETLQAIVEEAEQGNWKRAMRESRQILDDQIRR